MISAVPRSDVKLRRFPMVNYIEDVLAPVKKEFDIATHWLGQERDFGQHKQTPLLQIRDLNMRFTLRNAFLKKNRIILDAVKQVSFSIKEGEVFGLVGESGSGKSTIARLIAGLYKARSEEHTSELQSLMRISYAVFCLKKKNRSN